MRRFHGVELSDLTWFPPDLREAGNAYLRFAGELFGQPEKILPVIESALDRSGEKEILDLCSGGAGAHPLDRARARRAGPTGPCDAHGLLSQRWRARVGRGE